jgi:hypothetical protein
VIGLHFGGGGEKKRVVSILSRAAMRLMPEERLRNLDWAWARRNEETLIVLLDNLREDSLVVSWLGMGVERLQRVFSSKPMVGWKGEHPQLVGWLILSTRK